MRSITVVIAPGPLMSGTPRGTTAGSASVGSTERSGSWLVSMGRPMRRNTKPPPIRNASIVIAKSLKRNAPESANTTSTPIATRQARSAILRT